MQILLSCNAGMSTSLLARRINQAAKQLNRDDTACCIDVDKLEDLVGEMDILFLAPQLTHAYTRIWTTYHERLPIALVPGTYYGRLDGEGLLGYADMIMEAYRKDPSLKFSGDYRKRRF